MNALEEGSKHDTLAVLAASTRLSDAGECRAAVPSRGGEKNVDSNDGRLSRVVEADSNFTIPSGRFLSGLENAEKKEAMSVVSFNPASETPFVEDLNEVELIFCLFGASLPAAVKSCIKNGSGKLSWGKSSISVDVKPGIISAWLEVKSESFFVNSKSSGPEKLNGSRVSEPSAENPEGEQIRSRVRYPA